MNHKFCNADQISSRCKALVTGFSNSCHVTPLAYVTSGLVMAPEHVLET